MRTALAWMLFSAAALFAVYRLTPPAAVGADAPANEFSGARALRHLEVIAREPRVPGTQAHAQARQYILDNMKGFGLEARQHDGTAVSNVVARLAGTKGGGKAVVLVAHYDTVPQSPGVGDDGYGVATLLETARALKAGRPTINDVLFLFTDGEERGLLGAKAFVNGDAWGGLSGLVLNFDARGDSGSFLMFQTSGPDMRLAEVFGRAGPSPVANSLMSDIYRMLPNDTDFTVFADAGVPGLNFACIDGFHAYHKPADNLGNGDVRTLQHAGSQALALARGFGDADLNSDVEGRAVYFDILRATLVRYPQEWALPLVLFAGLLLLGLVAYGLSKRRLTASGLAQGLLAVPLCVAGAAVLVTTAQSLGSNGATTAARGYVYRDLYLLGLLALVLAATSGVYAWFRRGVGARDLTAGALVWWLVLATLTVLFLPGGSYLFTWPLLLGLVALALSLVARGAESISKGEAAAAKSERRTAKSREGITQTWPALFAVCAVPAGTLVFPLAYLLLVGLALQWAGGVMALVVLALALIVPHTFGADSRGGYWFPAGSALGGLMLIALVRLGS